MTKNMILSILGFVLIGIIPAVHAFAEDDKSNVRLCVLSLQAITTNDASAVFNLTGYADELYFLVGGTSTKERVIQRRFPPTGAKDPECNKREILEVKGGSHAWRGGAPQGFEIWSGKLSNQDIAVLNVQLYDQDNDVVFGSLQNLTSFVGKLGQNVSKIINAKIFGSFSELFPQLTQLAESAGGEVVKKVVEETSKRDGKHDLIAEFNLVAGRNKDGKLSINLTPINERGEPTINKPAMHPIDPGGAKTGPKEFLFRISGVGNKADEDRDFSYLVTISVGDSDTFPSDVESGSFCHQIKDEHSLFFDYDKRPKRKENYFTRKELMGSDYEACDHG